jgi:hypothetical protein
MVLNLDSWLEGENRFGKGIQQNNQKSFGQKAVFLRSFCGRREGKNRR